MANIAISDIHPAGYNLLSDNESYMTEFNNDELNHVVGGITIFLIAGLGYQAGKGISQALIDFTVV